MSTPQSEVPKYLHHTQSGGARVYIDGEEIYLGPYDAPESREKYDRLIAEWLAAGRQLPNGYRVPLELTISELIIVFMKHAAREYCKNGRPTREFKNLKPPLRIVQKLYGSLPAAQFGPRALKAVREAMLVQHVECQKGKSVRQLSRKYVNQSIDRIRRMFRWAVGDELIPAFVLHALDAVPGLRHGKGGRETAKITVVPEPFIDAVEPHVSRQVWALIQLQLCTGMRPCEAISLRGSDLDTSGKLWEVNPTQHKTSHFGINRVIFLGTRAQDVVRPFLKTDLERFLFSASDARQEQYAKMRVHRRTRVQPSQVCRKKRAPQRRPGEHYTVDSYRRAIARACDLATEIIKCCSRDRPVTVECARRIVHQPYSVRPCTALRRRGSRDWQASGYSGL